MVGDLNSAAAGGSSRSAVVFDMDGVLLDSVRIWLQVIESLLAEHGKSIRDFAGDAVAAGEAMAAGDSTRQWATLFRKVVGIPLTEAEIVERVLGGIMAAYERHIPLIPGAEEVVAQMAAHLPVGLASSSPRPVIEYVLAETGLGESLTVWVSSDDVECGKPAPDVYLRCCELLGATPALSVAVEDSPSGIRAAKAAGMKVIAVPNPTLPLDTEARALADAALTSITELDPVLADVLIGAGR